MNPEVWHPLVVEIVVKRWTHDQKQHHNNLFKAHKGGIKTGHTVEDWTKCVARSCGMVYQDCLNLMAEARMEQMNAIKELARHFSGE